ncbi:MAG: flagellar M-ring protein FliF [Methylocystis sp.]|nr:flagellar M-ring protein FliF [Methylocystis sp.]MCA3583757.1 flagellar M-ring protein FliF [Methylocystis sp.]MCA3586430.1 flagellar M-ring protein FliF [Methylocystis sp.]MCA3589969.1 flagellar M-ring protein FliF [Methylocystis sp.]
MNGVVDVLKKLGPQKLMALGAVALALMAFFAFIIMRVTAPTMTTLFTDMTLQDSNAVTRELDQRGIKYEIRNDGGTIMVPKDNVLRLRMDLASKGLPQGGGVGYEIFDKSDSMSTTSFVQNVNQLRALEGELARTIRSLDRVQNARVHLALPEKQLFQREKREARASIVLKVRGELEASQVRAIRHLVATAVEGLKPDRVSVVDEAGRLLADGSGDSQDTSIAAAEKQQGFERRVRQQVEEIVASVVGRGRARVQVAAEMDFNRIQQTQENFDPESRVVRSTQTRNENNVTNEARDGQVTVNNELPGASGQNSNASREASQKNEETVNYEISKTVRTEVIEGGRVKRLSVAVLVDGYYAKGGKGDMEYQARSPEELERITALVRSAIGFDQRRGDTIEVVNLRFAEAPIVSDLKELTLFERLFSFSKDDTFRMLELGVLCLVSIFVFMFVVRPLMATIAAPDKAAKTVMVQGPNGQVITVAAPQALQGPEAPSTDTEKMIEMSQINGAIQARSIEKVGEVASKNPQETVAILRQWIHGSGG